MSRRIDFEERSRELDEYLRAEHGVTLDELLDKAAVHFAGDKFGRRTKPLTDEERRRWQQIMTCGDD